MRMWRAILATVALAAAAPAMAADVAARDPASLAEALKAAGYGVELGTDDTGDPVLNLEMAGYKIRLLFLDCNPASHDQCGSVQFFAAFDAEGSGLSPQDALQFARRYRYAAVTVSANGDPALRWDVETGAGIPAEVFTTAAARFLGTVQAMGTFLFPQVAGN
jgi:hypothetical protein